MSEKDELRKLREATKAKKAKLSDKLPKLPAKTESKLKGTPDTESRWWAGRQDKN